MRANVAITIIVLIFSLFSLKIIIADTDEINVSLDVDSSCGNGTCEAVQSENDNTCPTDCGCNSNGVCQAARGETEANCSDCEVSVTPPSTEGGGGPVLIKDKIPPVIYNLSVKEVTPNSAEISWDTDEQAICKTSLGQTIDYETLTVSESVFFRTHHVSLSELNSSTLYHFNISCLDTSENQAETGDQQFITLKAPDITPPLNVSDFTAMPGNKEITLSWKNPTDNDFRGVRIIRSEEMYPSSPFEGEYIYEGDGISFVDKGLENGKRYYYTAFSYDDSGNFSSGAITFATPSEKPEEIISIPPEEVFPKGITPSEVEKININDFDFIKEGKNIPIAGGKTISLNTGDILDISIDYEKVPEVLKTIMVTIEKEGQFFSFLLRSNKDKTRYEASVLTPLEAGIYPVTITILDYKNQAIKIIKGEIMGEAKARTVISSALQGWLKNTGQWIYVIPILLILLILLAILIAMHILRRKKRYV